MDWRIGLAGASLIGLYFWRKNQSQLVAPALQVGPGEDVAVTTQPSGTTGPTTTAPVVEKPSDPLNFTTTEWRDIYTIQKLMETPIEVLKETRPPVSQLPPLLQELVRVSDKDYMSYLWQKQKEGIIGTSLEAIGEVTKYRALYRDLRGS